MTSRERVYKAIIHRIPDRVPIDLGAMRSTWIMSIAYNSLKDEQKVENLISRKFNYFRSIKNGL